MLTTRKVLVFSIMIVFSLLTTIWVNSTRIDNKSYETNKFQLKPVHKNTLWGAKLISGDGSHKLFAGIQKVVAGIDDDNFISLKVKSDSGNIKNHQIKLNLGKIDISFKILSYSQTAPKNESQIQNGGKTITQLNYIEKSSPCKKRNKNDFVLLKNTIPDDPDSNDMIDSKTTAVFAVLLQIIPN
jgi:hypothetical protein